MLVAAYLYYNNLQLEMVKMTVRYQEKGRAMALVVEDLPPKYLKDIIGICHHQDSFD
jgi:hypothetical protein